MVQHVHQPLLSVRLVCHITIRFDDLKSVIELLLPVHLAHVSLELRVVAARNIDHLLTLSLVALGGRRRFVVGDLVVSVVVAESRARDRAFLLHWIVVVAARVLVLLTESLDIVHVHLIENLGVLSVLWLEIKVDLETLHVLLQLLLLLALFLLCFLLLLFFLFVDLESFELVKHILVVQNSVREFLFKIVLVEQGGDTLLDEWNFEDLVDAGSLVRLRPQHQSQQVKDVLAEVSRRVGVLALDDFLCQLVQTLGVERRHQSAHLVQQHSKRPDVRFEGVGLRLDDLWREVVGSAHDGLCFGLGLAQDTGDAEVSQLDHASLGQENVLRLQVTVQNLSIVDVLECQANLREPVEHVVFVPVFQLAAVLVS